MTAVRLDKGLYVITEHRHLDFPELLARTEAILETGIAALQYRNKTADRKQKLYEAGVLQTLCADRQTPFLVNDDIELARTLEADGVHLGKEDNSPDQARQRLGDGFIVGISCYNESDKAEQAVRQGVDYIAFGAMFPTDSKTGTAVATPGLISAAKQKYRLPVAAIGGITPDNCLPLIRAGADLLAVISSVYLNPDPAAVTRRFNKLIKGK